MNFNYTLTSFQRFKNFGKALTLSCLLVFLSASFSQCHKKPTVGFNIDKGEYSAGEKVSITNYSKDVYRQDWSFYDANGYWSSSNDEIPDYKIPLLNDDGIYTVKLIAYSKRDKKSSTLTKTFVVKTLRTSLAITCSNSAVKNFNVQIDDENIGNSENKYFVKDIPAGIRFVKITTDGKIWTQTINLVYPQSYLLTIN